MAQAVGLASGSATFPGRWETPAEQAMEYHSVRAALLAAQQDAPSTSPSTVTNLPDNDPFRWLVQPARQPAAVRSMLRGVVGLAEQAPNLSDEQLRSRVAALGELVR